MMKAVNFNTNLGYAEREMVVAVLRPPFSALP